MTIAVSGRRITKASDLPDAVFLEIVRQYNDGTFPVEWSMPYGDTPDWRRERGGWAFYWDIERITGAPLKVLWAKARRLERRGLLTGCTGAHNCRGDLEVTDEGRAYIARRVAHRARHALTTPDASRSLGERGLVGEAGLEPATSRI